MTLTFAQVIETIDSAFEDSKRVPEPAQAFSERIAGIAHLVQTGKVQNTHITKMIYLLTRNFAEGSYSANKVHGDLYMKVFRAIGLHMLHAPDHVPTYIAYKLGPARANRNTTQELLSELIRQTQVASILYDGYQPTRFTYN